ncbi:ubiquitin C-terminal hydrolase L3 [Penicillium chermesinum]|uniref:Ubiquitin carboxyl-terminal hydrolase n=1 Tax=Penicillium chermesinum TaxID=63820 RepID=A0A9W9N9D5_9EURO|nr:ubiquitin C-terminal hydrolase L3 [Penicillium chermesinum]KAJ5214868.1 ubiquitin C-terminal hydrolase L3 [Penicillium chermesinum]
MQEEKDSSTSWRTGSACPSTIRNSCGLIALLHAVANGEPRRHVTPGSDLAALLERADPLPPAERARSLQYSKGLESVYMDAAQMGDTEAPEAEDNVDLHFVAFVRGSDGTLWEMDGRRKGPLARGVLAPDEDVLSANALEMGVRRFLKAEIEGGNQDMRFSLICLGPGLD